MTITSGHYPKTLNLARVSRVYPGVNILEIQDPPGPPITDSWIVARAKRSPAFTLEWWLVNHSTETQWYVLGSITNWKTWKKSREETNLKQKKTMKQWPGYESSGFRCILMGGYICWGLFFFHSRRALQPRYNIQRAVLPFISLGGQWCFLVCHGSTGGNSRTGISRVMLRFCRLPMLISGQWDVD